MAKKSDDPPHSCRCGKRWGGLTRAHCSRCHLTFNSVYAFDRHIQRTNRHVHPLQVDMFERNRIWYGEVRAVIPA